MRDGFERKMCGRSTRKLDSDARCEAAPCEKCDNAPCEGSIPPYCAGLCAAHGSSAKQEAVRRGPHGPGAEAGNLPCIGCGDLGALQRCLAYKSGYGYHYGRRAENRAAFRGIRSSIPKLEQVSASVLRTVQALLRSVEIAKGQGSGPASLGFCSVSPQEGM